MNMMEQPSQQQQGAGGIINQRSEMIGAIGPGTANYAKLPPNCQAQIKSIAAKGLADWTDYDTGFVASMFSVAVHC